MPPAPGINPRRTSGKPSLASFAAIRRSHASASSKPAAHRGPSDLGHRNLGQPFDPCVKPLNAGDIGIHPIGTIGRIHARAHFLEIGASTEHFLIGADVQYPATRPGSQRIKLCVE